MTETPMRERLARAACRVSCTACPENGTCWDWKPTLPEIDAILAELERPSEGMVEAAAKAAVEAGVSLVGNVVYRQRIVSGIAASVIAAMIRAAREGK
jgi:hypothetical protein